MGAITRIIRSDRSQYGQLPIFNQAAEGVAPNRCCPASGRCCGRRSRAAWFPCRDLSRNLIKHRYYRGGKKPVGGAPVTSAENLRKARPYRMQRTGPASLDIANAANTPSASLARAKPNPRNWPGRWRQILEHPAARYGAAVGFVLAACGVAWLTGDLTGRFLTFPFYAAVVLSAWFGLGPSIASFLLSALATADFYTPSPFDLSIGPDELPSFIAFVCFALLTLAWSSQRRREQRALEATVQQRTADLLRTNAALQVEIAEREAAEADLRHSETLLAQG